jgi:hypothetical protein
MVCRVFGLLRHFSYALDLKPSVSYGLYSQYRKGGLDPNAVLEIGNKTRAVCERWLEVLRSEICSSFSPAIHSGRTLHSGPTQVSLYTDAFKEGLCGFCHCYYFKLDLTPARTTLPTLVLKLVAFYRGILAFHTLVRGFKVLLLTDSMAVKDIAAKGRARSELMQFVHSALLNSIKWAEVAPSATAIYRMTEASAFSDASTRPQLASRFAVLSKQAGVQGARVAHTAPRLRCGPSGGPSSSAGVSLRSWPARQQHRRPRRCPRRRRRCHCLWRLRAATRCRCMQGSVGEAANKGLRDRRGLSGRLKRDGASVVVTPAEDVSELYCVYLLDCFRWLFVNQLLRRHQVFAVMHDSATVTEDGLDTAITQWLRARTGGAVRAENFAYRGLRGGMCGGRPPGPAPALSAPAVDVHALLARPRTGHGEVCHRAAGGGGG